MVTPSVLCLTKCNSVAWARNWGERKERQGTTEKNKPPKTGVSPCAHTGLFLALQQKSTKNRQLSYSKYDGMKAAIEMPCVICGISAKMVEFEI